MWLTSVMMGRAKHQLYAGSNGSIAKQGSVGVQGSVLLSNDSRRHQKCPVQSTDQLGPVDLVRKIRSNGGLGVKLAAAVVCLK
jgi:hypothetical protein